MSSEPNPNHDSTNNLQYYHFEIKLNSELMLSGTLHAESRQDSLKVVIEDNPSVLKYKTDFNDDDVRINELRYMRGLDSWELHGHLRE